MPQAAGPRSPPTAEIVSCEPPQPIRTIPPVSLNAHLFRRVLAEKPLVGRLYAETYQSAQKVNLAFDSNFFKYAFQMGYYGIC